MDNYEDVPKFMAKLGGVSIAELSYNKTFRQHSIDMDSKLNILIQQNHEMNVTMKKMNEDIASLKAQQGGYKCVSCGGGDNPTRSCAASASNVDEEPVDKPILHYEVINDRLKEFKKDFKRSILYFWRQQAEDSYNNLRNSRVST